MVDTEIKKSSRKRRNKAERYKNKTDKFIKLSW